MNEYVTMAWLAGGVILQLVGLVGCVVPAIPGPFVSYCGLLALVPTDKCPSMTMLILTGLGTLAVTALDYVVPAVGARKFDCTKAGVWGSIAGSVVGMFFFPWGLFVGAFAGALIGELLAGKRLGASFKGAWGAFLGGVAGMAIKIAWCLALAGCLVFAGFAG